MTRRALLIGSATGGLTGPGNDTAALAAALTRWDFDPVVCDGENASRAGILDAYEQLIARSRPDDAAVVYYSGHGAYAKDPALAEGMPGPGVLQFIIPTDYEESSEDDFRGIANVELSLLLEKLTARTRNAAVILDCCHSGAMSRDLETGAVAKVWPRAVPACLARAHLDSLHRTCPGLAELSPRGNPDAVRLVACATNQRAYEAPNADDVTMGYFTDALTRVLDTLDPAAKPLSWATVGDRVRQLVLRQCGVQRPDSEGPRDRELFGTGLADQAAALPASRHREWIRISGGRPARLPRGRRVRDPQRRRPARHDRGQVDGRAGGLRPAARSRPQPGHSRGGPCRSDRDRGPAAPRRAGRRNGFAGGERPGRSGTAPGRRGGNGGGADRDRLRRRCPARRRGPAEPAESRTAPGAGRPQANRAGAGGAAAVGRPGPGSAHPGARRTGPGRRRRRPPVASPAARFSIPARQCA